MGLEISTPAVLIRSEPNVMINKAVIREHKLINILATGQTLPILWFFEISICESIGKS